MQEKDDIDDDDLRHYLWRDGDLDWKLDTLQVSISETVRANPTAKRLCILSSRQIGKSFWSCVFSLCFLIRSFNSIARVIAPTNKQCAEIVRDNLNPLIATAPKDLIDYRPSEQRWNIRQDGSLRLGALERQYVDNNRGGNAKIIIYEEVGFVQADDFNYGVNSVIGPQLIRSEGIEIFISSPSEDPDHPLHTEIAPECEHLGTLFAFTVFHSPSLTDEQIITAATRTGTKLTKAFVADVRRLPIITIPLIHQIAQTHDIYLTDGFRREYLAEVIRPSTLMVVPTFSPKKHVHPFEIHFLNEWNVTIDWGGVKDYTVALLHTYSHLLNKDMIYDEHKWDANTPTDVIVTWLRTNWHSKYNIQTVWADVAGQTSVDCNALDYPIALPQKSDWLASVNAMSTFFSLDRVMVHPQCDFLIRSLRGGMFNKLKTNFQRSEKLGHCDALAALMYAFRSQSRDKIVEIQSLPPRERYVAIVPDVDPELREVARMITGGKAFGSFKK